MSFDPFQHRCVIVHLFLLVIATSIVLPSITTRQQCPLATPMFAYRSNATRKSRRPTRRIIVGMFVVVVIVAEASCLS